jgi:hypothetical protein
MKTDMVKNMLFVGPEGETLDLDGSVVDKEKAMKENPRKRKEIEETDRTLPAKITVSYQKVTF